MAAPDIKQYRCVCKHGHGSSRSLVRRIGSCLPISTGKRIVIRVPGMDSPAAIHMENEFRYEATGQRYVPNEEGLTLASYINHPRQLLTKAVGVLDLDEDSSNGGDGVPVAQDEEVGVAMDTGEGGVVSNSQEARDKITALESELAQLKAQIAMYALTEVEPEEDSTDSAFQPPPPPPPPLPPPPPATPAYQRVVNPGATPADGNTGGEGEGGQIQPSAHIAGGRGAAATAPTTMAGRLAATPAAAGRPPDMGDVLQDIGSVRLRAVANMTRSPGGTPLRPKNRGGRGSMSDPNDPAAIIAQALRKKFAHKVFKDSPDKENLDRSDMSLNASTFESPTAKLLK